MKKGMMVLLGILLVSLLCVSPAISEVVRGKVASVDLKASSLSFEVPEGGTLILSYDPNDFIVWKGDDEVEAKMIKVGSEAEVGYYTDERDAKIASWVDLTPVEIQEEMVAPAEAAPRLE